MNFESRPFGLQEAAGLKVDALIVLVSRTAKPGSGVLAAKLSAALSAGHFEPKAGKLLSLYAVDGVTPTRVVFAGCDEGRPRQVRQAVAAATQSLKGPKLRRLAVAFAGDVEPASQAAVVGAVADATYSYTATKSKPEPRALERVLIGGTGAPSAAAIQRAAAIVHGVELAKEWANRPGNHATPTRLAEAASALAAMPGIACEVMGPKKIAKLGMGSFMAVAQGSAEEARFIVLRYDGAGRDVAPSVLVGKGITFDTGGISLKPAPEMDEMKFDMGGAASVLGVFRALGELRPAINVVGLIPSCENMPDGRAVKPGDVVTSMSGQTIEILNTDAEGRLILCDALTYAERFKPKAVIDIATLTGACVIALGGVRSGLFASDDALAQSLLDAGEAALDPCWRLPLDDEYAEGLKSPFADVANVGGRPAGAITAAKFLHRFATKYPWAHLDIAGTAWKSGAAKGATGRPVPLLVAHLLGADAAAASPRARRARRG